MNQDNAKPVIPRFSRTHRSVWGSTVSKAALIYKSTRKLRLPSALLNNKTLKTLHNAVSTEWNRLSADWNWAEQSKLFNIFRNSSRQAYSTTLDKNDVMYKSRYEFKISGSLPFLALASQKHFFQILDLKVQLIRLQ